MDEDERQYVLHVHRRDGATSQFVVGPFPSYRAVDEWLDENDAGDWQSAVILDLKPPEQWPD